MRSLLNSSKGQQHNYVAGIVFLFIFFITSIFAYYLLSVFTTEFAATSVASAETDLLGQQFLNSIAIFDYLGVLIFIVIVISIGMSSYNVAASPIYFIITFIISPFLGLFGYIMSYTFSQFASQTVFATIIVMFPRTVMLGTNFHWIMLVFIVVGSITLYAKNRGGQEQLG